MIYLCLRPNFQVAARMEISMDIKNRLDALRRLMQQKGMQAYIVVTDDFHGSEYVGDYFKARAYMTGFTGSAGTLVVLQDRACMWTDGRYFLQAADQLQGSGIELMRMGEKDVPTIPEFLEQNLTEKSVIGFDGRTISNDFAGQIAEKVKAKNITFAYEEDLVDLIWQHRPHMSQKPVWELDICYAGQTREEKLGRVRQMMEQRQVDYFVMTSLDEIAWLLNLRGDDVLCTPVFLSYMLLTKEQAVLYVQEEIINEEIRAKLAACGVILSSYHNIYYDLSRIGEGQKVLLDGGFANYRIVKSIPDNVQVVDEESPVIAMKAVKNSTEMENLRKAHIKDGVAVTRFIYWLKKYVGKEKITELGAAAKLEEFRAQMKGFMGPSFESILAYGAHGAIVHYEPTEETDVEMKPRGFCLADTGGQYYEGTTDITRTIALGELTEEERKAYTLVLRGHLNLGAAKFLHGVCGANLDYLAREPLWENGMDYNHGTGHGVGYLLNVHEGPQRIHWRITKQTKNTVLEEGMVTSNEPGLYLTGKFGIRHENLVLVRRGEANEYGQFMFLEELTMVPFDREAVIPSLMSDRELDRLNAYHRKVYHAISPYLEGEELDWLEKATAPLGKSQSESNTPQ